MTSFDPPESDPVRAHLPSIATVRHQATVTRARREALNGHRSAIVWFTGLSASGKSTLAHAVEEVLHERGCRTLVLDGDNVRQGLCSDLGFSIDDRHENIRRVGEVARIFLDAGVIVLTAFISPYREDRARVRNLVGRGDFIEAYCNAPVAICEARDPKGLYRRARAGQIAEFTGVSAPYEAPTNADLVLATDRLAIEECVRQVVATMIDRGIVPAR